MKLEPILTEKSLNLAKEGKYTFLVGKFATKYQIKKLVEETYGVHPVSIWTLKKPGEVKRTLAGRKRIINSVKKAIVELTGKEKIDAFEGKK